MYTKLKTCILVQNLASLAQYPDGSSPLAIHSAIRICCSMPNVISFSLPHSLCWSKLDVVKIPDFFITDGMWENNERRRRFPPFFYLEKNSRSVASNDAFFFSFLLFALFFWYSASRFGSQSRGRQTD